ncbi:MAG: CAP domain-containing protein [Candidatus Saccharibacteria bacterium]|nr:CAP domain-containing protein [Candidatus Saccharibacteria bacterium]
MRWMYAHSNTSLGLKISSTNNTVYPEYSNKYIFKVLKSVIYVTLLVALFFLSKAIVSQQYSYSISQEQSVNAPKPQVLASFDNSESIASGLPSADTVFDLVNAQRVANNLDPLIKNPTLSKLANDRANDMVARNYYAHKNPDGYMFFDLLEQQNYQTGFACENLDLSFINDPNQYVTDWKNSSHGHKECMLDSRLTDAGYAIVAFDPSDSVDGIQEYIVVAIHAEIN